MQTYRPSASQVDEEPALPSNRLPPPDGPPAITAERLTRALDYMADGVLILDKEGRCSYANAVAERILNVDRRRSADRSSVVPQWQRLTLDGRPLPPDEYPFARVRRTGTPVRNAELIVVRPDGVQITLSVNAAPLHDTTGAFDGMVAILSDITEQKRAEQALAGMREREAIHRRGEETAQLLRAQLTIYGQDSMSGLLRATAEAGRRLGIPAPIGCLLRDPGLDAWYLTTLLDPEGRPVDIASLGVPAGPFAFRVPESAAPRPLAQLMDGAWEPNQVAGLERALSTTAALCIPVPGAARPRGALLALLPDEDQAVLLAGVLAHAASGAARHLAAESLPVADAVLPSTVFAERAADEILRAERYHRPLSLVVFETDRLDEMAQLGLELSPALRRWDLLGRLDVDRPAIAAVLPETSRAGARGLIERLSGDLLGVRTGAASFPEDGAGFAHLVEIARGRAVRLHGTAVERWTIPAASNRIWRRGAPTGPDAHVVRCPICLVPYSRRVRATTDALVLEQAWVAARDALQASCPCHPDEMVV
jgi:hypothetical protein